MATMPSGAGNPNSTLRLTLVDSRRLAVSLWAPIDQWWDWTISAWSTPFNAVVHLLPFSPVESAPAADAPIITADLGTALLGVTGGAAFVWNMNPLGILDPNLLQFPILAPGMYGWPR